MVWWLGGLVGATLMVVITITLASVIVSSIIIVQWLFPVIFDGSQCNVASKGSPCEQDLAE